MEFGRFLIGVPRCEATVIHDNVQSGLGVSPLTHCLLLVEVLLQLLKRRRRPEYNAEFRRWQPPPPVVRRRLPLHGAPNGGTERDKPE